MELLHPVAADAAKTWLDSLDEGATPELAILREGLGNVQIGTETPLFAGLDRNPANVLQRESDGRLVLTDAFWIEGPELLRIITEEPAAALALYPLAGLSNWAHLPCMNSETTSMILQQIESVV